MGSGRRSLQGPDTEPISARPQGQGSCSWEDVHAPGKPANQGRISASLARCCSGDTCVPAWGQLQLLAAVRTSRLPECSKVAGDLLLSWEAFGEEASFPCLGTRPTGPAARSVETGRAAVCPQPGVSIPGRGTTGCRELALCSVTWTRLSAPVPSSFLPCTKGDWPGVAAEAQSRAALRGRFVTAAPVPPQSFLGTAWAGCVRARVAPWPGAAGPASRGLVAL